MNKFTLWALVFLLSPLYSFAQNLTGTIYEPNGDPIIGANVVLKGTVKGTTTDFNGNFILDVKGIAFPFTIQISFIGYKTQDVAINSTSKPLKISMQEDTEMLSEVNIIEQRLSAKQRESALTVEALDALAIKETPAANFYEALGNLKGVDLTSASIGFKIINTRGFNSTSPVRSLQIIDGVDNQAPGLNFSLGNFLGASELDIANVDIIAGASTAFYGPGAFNGVISMTTKDPFLYQGISASVKVGERALTETAVRYAEAFKIGKVDYENFAFKVNLFYLSANDWEADNYDPVFDSPVGADNPGRYDAINIYGDESLESNNEFGSFEDVKLAGRAGLGTFYRPGYTEGSLVNYNTQNFKGNAGLFYKFKDETQVSYNFNYGTGTTVYQGENRFSLQGIQFFQNTVEVKKKDKFFVRAYSTVEDAGDSYDAVLTAFKMNEAIYGNERDWNNGYAAGWVRAPFRFSRAFQQAAGISVDDPSFDSVFYATQYQDVLRENNALLRNYHDSLIGIQNASYRRPEEGSPRFDSLKNYVTSRTFTEGGSKFFDQSALYHIMGEYQFHPDWADIRIGGNYRWYRPNSRGNIFDEIIPESIKTDSVGNIVSQEYRRITNEEFGAYVGAEKKFFRDLLKASATLRLDKNANFDYLISPAASLVYDYDQNNTFRFSAGRAIRNPTLQDQYLRYDVGRAVLLGNINGIKDLVSIESFDFYRSQSQLSRSNLNFFDIAPIEPEKVTTIELGYRASLFKRVFVDVNYFYSWYTNFIGFQFGLDLDFDPTFTDRVIGVQAFRVAANASELVTTQGFNIGVNYFLNDKLTLNGNYSYNAINLRGSDNPIIPAFNTPENKFNLGFVGRGYKLKSSYKSTLGFAATYKWVQGFLFEGSPQFSGFIESYGMLDAQVSYTVPKWYTTFKLGASNLLNNEVFQVYGGPSIGRLTYFSVTFEKF